jgi:hypothetical protein
LEPEVAGPDKPPRKDAEVKRGTAVALRDDQFFGMQLRQAVRECLRLADKPMTAPEIARVLKAHGLPSDKKEYTNSVYTALYREQKAGHVVQVPPGKSWGLIEWYPHLKGTANKPKPVAANGTTFGAAGEPSEPDSPTGDG